MTHHSEVSVPKSMRAEHVVWAFRYGVAWARYSVLNDNSTIQRHNLGFVSAPRNVRLLADRVRLVAEQRLRVAGGVR